MKILGYLLITMVFATVACKEREFNEADIAGINEDSIAINTASIPITENDLNLVMRCTAIVDESKSLIVKIYENKKVKDKSLVMLGPTKSIKQLPYEATVINKKDLVSFDTIFSKEGLELGGEVLFNGGDTVSDIHFESNNSELSGGSFTCVHEKEGDSTAVVKKRVLSTSPSSNAKTSSFEVVTSCEGPELSPDNRLIVQVFGNTRLKGEALVTIGWKEDTDQIPYIATIVNQNRDVSFAFKQEFDLTGKLPFKQNDDIISNVKFESSNKQISDISFLCLIH